MVDKIKPPDSSQYRVHSSPDASDEQRRRRDEGEERERDEFEQGIRWDKVLGKAGGTHRKIQIATQGVKSFTFKKLDYQHGTFTLEADLHTHDGKIQKGVLLQLPERVARERLKNTQTGHTISPELLSLGEFFHITIPFDASISPLDPRWAREIAPLKFWETLKTHPFALSLGIFSETGDPRWGVIFTYMLALAILAFALGAMIQVMR